MSTRADVDDADRLARVTLSRTLDPGDLRVTGLVSELGADKVLGYLEAAADVESHWGFAQELGRVDPAKVFEQAAGRSPRRRSNSGGWTRPARCIDRDSPAVVPTPDGDGLVLRRPPRLASWNKSTCVGHLRELGPGSDQSGEANGGGQRFINQGTGSVEPAETGITR